MVDTRKNEARLLMHVSTRFAPFLERKGWSKEELLMMKRDGKAPEGCININTAAKKYGVYPSTLHDWRKKNFIITVCQTSYEVYLDEASVAKAVALYKSNPGRGKKTMQRILSQSQ